LGTDAKCSCSIFVTPSLFFPIKKEFNKHGERKELPTGIKMYLEDTKGNL
jgi:hypothetical protein